MSAMKQIAVFNLADTIRVNEYNAFVRTGVRILNEETISMPDASLLRIVEYEDESSTPEVYAVPTA
jgi:hypothetical protein